MEISGKGETLWVNEHKKADGTTWKSYSVGVSSKKLDGSYLNLSMGLAFSKKVHVPADLENGSKFNFHGFMTVDSYTDRQGIEVKRHKIMVTQAEFDGGTPMPEPRDDNGVEFSDGFPESLGFAEVDDYDVPF